MRNEIEARMDSSGRLLGVRVHDGHLRQLAFADGEDASITIRATDGSDTQIQLIDVLAFGISKFTHGAIVSEVLAWKVADAAQLPWAADDNPWRVLSAMDDSVEGAMALSRQLIQAYPQATLIQVLCSYGGTMAAVCNSVRVYQIQEA